MLALAGCAHHGGGSPAAQSSGQAGIVALDSQSPSPTPTATSTQANGSTGNGGSNSGNGNGNQYSPSPTPTGPRIISFVVANKPSCPVVGTPDNPKSYPGQPVTIAWKISGATGVTLSVDGPGAYRDYNGKQGSETLSFGCDTSQRTSTHTYTITTLGPNSVAKTLTVSALSNP